jgi:phage tail-like protein
MTEPGHLYLNAANEWPSFELHGLEVAPDGVLRLEAASDGSYPPRGIWRSGPFEVLPEPTDWYRLQVMAESLPPRTHVQVFTFASDDPGAPAFDPTAEEPFADPGWQASPRDGLDVLLPTGPTRYLWIGGVVRSDGSATPALDQMRLAYGRDTYLAHLPALYGRQEGPRDLLERFLTLHESVLGGLEQATADLPRLFDPAAAPSGPTPSWLSWLAGWMAFEVSESWSDDETRQFVAEAFALLGRRGTVQGLRRYLKMYAGVEARIEEPALSLRVWSLGETSALGFDTMLAPEPPQGAVLDASAIVDAAHLTEGAAGPSLFADLAHRFCVQVHCAELVRPGALADARAVLEREKPAHTEAHLCVIEPLLRVGVQARVGIDAIVGAPPSARVGAVLGEGRLLAHAEPCEKEE